MAVYNLPEMPAGPVLELYGQRKRFTVPVGLKCLLEEMSREVLREQPDNIYDFLANYLQTKLDKQCANKERRKSWDDYRWSWEGSSLMTDEELMEFLELHNLTFGDANHIALLIQSAYRGYLGRKRFKSIKASMHDDDLYLEYDGEDAYITKDAQGNIIRFRGSDVEKILENYQLSLDKANKYAVKIQKTFRGYRTRESFAKEFPDLALHLQNIENRLRKMSTPPEEEKEEKEKPSLTIKETVEEEEYAGEDYYYPYEEEYGGEDYLPVKEKSKLDFGLESFGIGIAKKTDEVAGETDTGNQRRSTAKEEEKEAEEDEE